MPNPLYRLAAFFVFITVALPGLRANPTGGAVVAGEATISGGPGNLTINQTTARAIINWSDFSIGAGELTRFVQPDAASAVLNRVISGNPSSLLGDLQANGQVWLLNPNGILVGDGARLDTAGFLASTLNVTDQDFLAGGDLLFTGDSTAAITNLGAISASGGDIFLIARKVDNQGALTALDGTVGLGAGSEVLLTTGGDERVFIRTATAPGEVVNAGDLAAATAELKAAGGNAYALAINNTGTIRATGTAVRDGQVWLIAGTKSPADAKHVNAGATVHSGLITATHADGTGGFVETSGETIELSGTVTTGAGGHWLIDPTDLTIDSALAASTKTSLNAGTDVSIEADNTITVAASIAVNGSGDLELLSDIDRSGAGTVVFDSGITVANAGSGDVRLFYNPSAYTSPTDFSAKISSGSGEARAFMWVHDVDDLQAIDNYSGTYALSGDIDASATSGWNAGAGFEPIGASTIYFNGMFDGRGHVITGLTINRPTTNEVGLFGLINNAVVRNLGLEGGSVTGGNDVGALAGYVTGANITQSYATTAVTGTNSVGGLIGLGVITSITQSYATGAVTGSAKVGGVVGYGYQINMTQGYATGAVTGTSDVGGLIGYNVDGTFTNSYWDSTVNAASAGGTGLATTALQNGTLPDGFDAAGWSVRAGEYPKLAWQPLSSLTFAGTITDAAAGIDLTLWINGASAATTTTTTGGAFSFGYDPDLTVGTTALVYATGGNAAVGNRLVPLTDGGTSGVDVAASTVWMTSAATNLTSLIADMGTTAGTLSDAGLLYAVSGSTLSLDDGIDFKLDLTAGSFDFNTALGLTGHAVAINTTGTLTQGRSPSMALRADSVLLSGAGSFTFGGAYNEVGTLAADIDGALVFVNDANLVVGAVGSVSGVTAHSASISTKSELIKQHDLTVTSPIQVAAGQTLDLSALHTLSLNADLTLPDSNLKVTAGGTGSPGTINVTGAIKVNRFTLAKSGGDSVRWRQVGETLPAFSARDFQVNEFADFLRATGGTGTAEDPYLVTDIYGLQGMASDNQRLLHWALVADLDARDAGSWNGGLGFSPIGLGAAYFGGTFDGRGHTISNLTINRDDFNVGLFGFVSGADAVVQNINLVDVNITGGDSYAAGLIGSLDEATVRHATVSGTVTGSADALVGGLVGYSTEGTIEDVSSSAAITASGEYANAGGLVGNAWKGSITRARATGAVTGVDSTGGLVGVIEGVTIKDAYATGKVEGNDFVGGLVGEIYDQGSMQRTYATGAVTGRDFVGGLVGNTSADGAVLVEDGYATGAVAGRDGVGGLIGNLEISSGSATLRHVYATGSVSGETSTGGLAGALSGGVSVDSAFWNTETSGQATSAGSRGQGLTTAQFEDTAGFMERAKWDFENVWAPSSAGFLPELYRLSTVVRVDTTASRVYGDANPEFTPSLHGGTSAYVFGPSGDALDTPVVTTAADATSNVGRYALTGAGTAMSEQNVTYRLIYIGELSVTQRTLLASLTGDLDKTYDGTTAALLAGSNFALSGLVNDDGFTVTQTAGAYNSRNVAGATQITAQLDPEHLVAADGTLASNYVLPTRASGAAAITPASLTVTVANQTKSYGDTVDFAGDEFGATGLRNDEAIGSVALTSDGAEATAGVDELPYAISASDATGGTFDASNYSITYHNGALTITPKAITVTANGGSSTYGDTPSNPGLTADGLVNSETVVVLTGLANSFGIGATTGAGDHTLSVDGTLSNANYTITQRHDGTWTINPRALRVTADEANKTYGDLVTFDGDEFTSSGLQNGETIGEVTLDSDGAVETAGVDESPYAIRASNATGGTFDPSNYTITYHNGALTITPKAITVAATGGTSTYGDTPSNPGFTANGLVNSEAVSVLTGLANSFGIGATTGAGDHTLSVDGTLTNANYTITQRNDGTWTIDPRALSITANDADKTYGDLITFDGTEFASSGLQNSETIGSVALASDGAVETAGVGESPYAITASTATGGSFNTSNYSITFHNGALTIAPKAITVTASGGTSTYGYTPSDPGFTADGLVNSEAVSVLTGLANSFGIGATTGAGDHTLSVDGTLTNANYTITQRNDGTWTIDPRALSITANDANKTYGDLITFVGTEFGSTGLQNSETIGSVTLASDGAAATAGVASSPYAITASTATGGSFNTSNYTIIYHNGALTIAPKAIMVTATGGTSTYGDTPSNPGFTANGLVNSEAVSVLTGLANSFGIGATTGAGDHTLSVDGALTNANYTITQRNDGTWTIDPRALSITANDANKTYGDLITFAGTEFASSGLQNSETIGSVALASDGAVETAGVGESPYAITASNAMGGTFDPSNYSITYHNGALKVAPRELAVTMDTGQAKVYGDADPELTYTIGGRGLVNGDTLSGTPVRTAGETIGGYALSQGALEASPDYDFTFSGDTFTITPRAITLTAAPVSRVYGAADPALGVNLTAGTLGSVTVNDSLSDVTGTLSRQSGANVGAYDILLGHGAAAANYTITYNADNNAFTITPAPLTVTGDDAVRDFGQPNPNFTATLTGLVNNDTADVVTGLGFVTPATSGSAVGDYAITPFGASAGNYTLSYVDGALTINAAVVVGDTPVEVPTVDGNPVMSGQLAVIVLGDRFILVPIIDNAVSGTALDATLGLTLGEITSVPRTNGTLSGAGIGTGLSGMNFAGFEVVASLGGGSGGGTAGVLNDVSGVDSGLFREASMDMGTFRVVYREVLDRVRELAEGHTVFESSFENMPDGVTPQIVLLKSAPGSAPRQSEDNASPGDI